MRIIFVLPRYHPNISAAIKGLQDAGHNVFILADTEEKLENHASIAPYVPDENGRRFRDLHKVIADFRPDLVVIRESGRLSKVVSLLCTIRGIETIGYELRPYFSQFSCLRNYLSAIRRGRPLKYFTPVLGREAQEKVAAGAKYIPLPVESIDGLIERTYVPSSKVRILCVAKLAQPRKRHLLLLEALSKISKDFSFELMMVGDSGLSSSGASGDHRRKIDDVILENKLEQSVTIISDVKPGEMRNLYLKADICVLPADDEPLGIAPLEAMGFGCVPIVSTEVGSAGTISRSGVGHIFQAGDAEDLLQALKKYFSDHKKIIVEGEAAMRFAKLELSPSVFVQRLVDRSL